MPQPDPQLVFLLGLCQRTGTNYIHRLLHQHPECASLMDVRVGEDYVVQHAHLLEQFAGRVTSLWTPEWGYPEGLPEQLRFALGGAIERFFCESVSGHRTNEPVLLTKNPSTINLPLVPRLFPKAKIVVIIRDGRSVAASAVQGFQWDFDVAVGRWCQGAKEFLRFREEYGAREGELFHVVHYEDVVYDLEGSLRKLAGFLRIDAGKFDFRSARETPVIGSSFEKKSEKVDWKPTPAPKDFDPTARFASWTAREHARYRWLAGEVHEAVGYAHVIGPLTNAARGRQRLIDLGKKIRRAIRRMAGH